MTAQKTGSDLELHWTDTAGATQYALVSDAVASGSFGTELGRAASGEQGIVVPLGDSPLEFYLVAGYNPTCGLGPLR